MSLLREDNIHEEVGVLKQRVDIVEIGVKENKEEIGKMNIKVQEVDSNQKIGDIKLDHFVKMCNDLVSTIRFGIGAVFIAGVGFVFWFIQTIVPLLARLEVSK